MSKKHTTDGKACGSSGTDAAQHTLQSGMRSRVKTACSAWLLRALALAAGVHVRVAQHPGGGEEGARALGNPALSLR